MILVVGPRLEGNLVVSLAIQTYPSCHNLLAVGFLSLGRSGASSQFIDLPQDFPKQISGDSDLDQLEGDVPAMADHFCFELHQLLPQPRERSVLNLL